MVLLASLILFLGITPLLLAQPNAHALGFISSISSPSKNKSDNGTKAPPTARHLFGNNGSYGSGSHPKHKPANNQVRNLFTTRQLECPPGFPELCGDLLCCELDTVCCLAGGCCPDATPVCEPKFCCPSGRSDCGEECAPDGSTCCSATETYCVDPALSVCCGTGCMPTDGACCDDEGHYCDENLLLCCGEIAPGYFHFTDTVCCDNGYTCVEETTCCGDYYCETMADNDQCCPGTDNESVCCPKYATCCDGWCCDEGSNIAREFGECFLPYVEFDYNIITEIVENVCLGIRTHPPYYTSEEQILTYVGSDNNNYNYGPCFRPACCAGQTTPSGGKLECDEYPFANSEQGGVTAWASCVGAAQNSAQGGILEPFLKTFHAGMRYWVVILNLACKSVSPTALPSVNTNCLPLLTPVLHSRGGLKIEELEN